ncbi:MAG TPA: PAS domain-containing protein [Fimbriimonadaceae bacterium]|nr:PAS domain-containing protein [Fimbriimonadaceae bacterium]HRJ33514.1 PAS domain-containing protein [Fimbriimonadaceae bacterium]
MFPLGPNVRASQSSGSASQRSTTSAGCPQEFGLSPREVFVIEQAALGLTDRGIANHLGIAVATVSTYWGRIRAKMGGGSRTELVARYVKAAAARAQGQSHSAAVWIDQLSPYTRTQEDIDRILQFVEEGSDSVHESYAEVARERDLFFEHSDNLCAIFENGKFLRVNRRWQETMDFRPDDLIGQSWEHYCHPDDLERVQLARQRVLAGESLEVSYRFRNGNGHYVELLWIVHYNPRTNRSLSIAKILRSPGSEERSL